MNLKRADYHAIQRQAARRLRCESRDVYVNTIVRIKMDVFEATVYYGPWVKNESGNFDRRRAKCLFVREKNSWRILG